MSARGKIAALIVAAGAGSRAGEGVPKQFRLIDGQPMLRHSILSFAQHSDITTICVVIGDQQQDFARSCLADIDNLMLVIGGDTRRESVYNGLKHIASAGDISAVLIHDAARPFLPAKVIDDLIGALESNSGAVPALPIVDSLARSSNGATLSASEDRTGLWRIQTPQAFRLDAICAAHEHWNAADEATDDARMAMAAGFDVAIVPGDEKLAKYTFASDFSAASSHSMNMLSVRTGSGFDVHRLVTGEELWLCGIRIDYEKGLSGHSDADVALHALTDALLGAAAMGDIGDHFPPTDPQWRGASSDQFLAHAASLVRAKNYGIANVDLTIICEAPKIGPHRAVMRQRVSEILQLDTDCISIKATTTEKLGYTGRGEGIAAQAVATLIREKTHAG